jgi:hypothetical protein
MTTSLPERVEQACRELAASSAPITFPAVADLAGIGRATLYRRPELRAVVEEHRQHTREALTLTGLAIQLDQLRAGLEAVATKVRRQEEELRKLRRPSRTSQT